MVVPDCTFPRYFRIFVLPGSVPSQHLCAAMFVRMPVLTANVGLLEHVEYVNISKESVFSNV